MAKFRSAFLLLTALQLAWTLPAAAQNAQVVHVQIRVSNSADGSPVPSINISAQEQPSECNGQRTGSAVYGETDGQGIATLGFISCPGPLVITVFGGSFFPTQREEIQLVAGQASYQITIALEPKAQRPSLPSNKYSNQNDRVLHIRVRGRLANGSLVPVHFATVYDRNGRHVATTNYDGIAVASVREVMGETVTMRAEGSHWREATSSFIVGASEGGTRLTREDDYVNFVLNGENTNQEENLELAIRVRGNKNGKHVNVHFASVYDAEGRHLVTTGYDGQGTAHVKAQLGEEYVVKVDATHWKPATETVTVGSAGGAGATTTYRHVDFLLEPEQAGAKLTVEVLDRNTDKPIPAASVTLYKPASFPGTVVGRATTNHKGEATFDAEEMDSALLNGQARVGATHGGAKSEVQTIAGSLLSGEAPRYVIYMTAKEENTRWSGTWYSGPSWELHTMQISGGKDSLGFTNSRHQPSTCSNCVAMDDEAGGSCTVSGNLATCKWHAHYHDSTGKDVVRSGEGTFTFVGGSSSAADTIQSRFLQKTGTITLANGTCPHIEECTRMSPGSIWTGSWKRHK